MIPRALYDDYTAALTENDRQARAALSAIVAAIGEDDIDALRDAMLEAYPALVRLYGERSAQVALEFYMGVREAQNVSTAYYATLPALELDSFYGETVSDVRREVGGLYSGASTISAFVSTMQDMATKRTMQLADSTLYSLSIADPTRPLFALIPNPDACAWCVMLGSRGFTNPDGALEHMRHDGCRCAIVADWDAKNPALEGYDRWKHFDVYYDANTEANKRKWLDEWYSMPKDEKAKYVRRRRDPKTGKVKEYPGDWSTYARNRMVQEMRKIMKSGE